MDYLLSQQPQQGNMEQAQGQAPYNPFNAGIRNAIESARQSLDMTDKQQDKALRRSMLAFAEHMGNEPRQKGFLANFGAAARSLAPAITAYDEDESAALTENNAFANQLLAHQAAEQQRQAQEEQTNWQRDFSERQLGETTRSHNLLEGFRRDKLASEQAANNPVASVPESFAALGSDLIPIERKNERLIYAKDKKSTGEILNELSSIKKDYEKFRDLTKDQLVDPMAPYGIGTAANEATDFFGYFLNNKNLQEATKERKALDSKLRKFTVELERKLKGGVLSMGMVNLFENKDILPSLKRDRPEVFEQKLEGLMEEMSNRNKAAETSLKYNVHISPYDLQKLTTPQRTSTEGNQAPQTSTEQVFVEMMDPETGEKREMLLEQVPKALEIGLIEVK